MKICRPTTPAVGSFLLIALVVLLPSPTTGMAFNRIATYSVCKQLDPTCNTDAETVAEIVDATADGQTLVYTDGKLGVIGFIDISDAANPSGLGTLEVGGEPTSVAVKGDFALAAVNTSPSFVNPSGKLVVIEIATQTAVREVDLFGQPDSIAISPDGNYAAVAIENERDEDLNDGALPQLPAGFLIVMDISNSDPNSWVSNVVQLTGLTNIRFPTDPEPEYVSINSDNIAVVTLQENNGLVLVDLPTLTVLADYDAGSVPLLEQVDTEENNLIDPSGTLQNIPREPDAVAWIGTSVYATADEGDLDGGSRSFTIYDAENGQVMYSSGNLLDILTIRYGHYPEERSENKGSEPEGIVFANYGTSSATPYLFVTSERGNVIFVFDVTDPANPEFKQILPSSVGPEGLKAIPDRNLLIAACEVDGRGDKIRAAIVIYELQDSDPTYPTIESIDVSGTPIPFSALSGLVASDDSTLYSVEDSFYKKSRIFKIDVSNFPAQVVEATRIKDSNGAFAAVLEGTDFAENLINDDDTVNVDLEGISLAKFGGFWLASEGRGTVGDVDRPVESNNYLFKVSEDGVIEKAVLLPDALNDVQLRFGFEGVAEDNGYVVVAFQRAWNGEDNPRLGVYNKLTGSWKFYYYPLDPVESQNRGWVGLSDITRVSSGTFLVVERDNQGGPDAAIKKIYKIDLGNYSMRSLTTITKTLFRDLMPDLAVPNGQIYEKIEGSALTPSGNVWICNDNDGVDDNSGEQQLIDLGFLVESIDNNSSSCLTLLDISWISLLFSSTAFFQSLFT